MAPRARPLRMRHLLVAVAMVLVVNAQLTWWIVFILGQNRARLELERGRLVAASEQTATSIRLAASEALAALEERIAAGADIVTEPAPAPFAEWWLRTPGPCPTGWRSGGDPPTALVSRGSAGCVEAVAASAWVGEVMEVGPELVVWSPARSSPAAAAVPTTPLQLPFAGWTVGPSVEAWQGLLDDYRGRITMVVSEGSFFALVLFGIIWFLWRTLRREVELERQHRNFLSAITHELKSPLAAMQLSLETVLGGRADAATSDRFLTNALRDTERLQGLVQKVLEVTRYGRRMDTVSTERSDVSAEVEDALRAFSSRALAAGAELETDIEPSLWAPVDREAFAIVVSNLLENAVKYGGTPPRVRVGLHPDGGAVVLEVEDNGGGVPSGEIPFIFERFYRAGDELRRAARGTGLGLYLVQQIVTAHRGKVVVEAAAGGGSVFRVRLPGLEMWEESA